MWQCFALHSSIMQTASSQSALLSSKLYFPSTINTGKSCSANIFGQVNNGLVSGKISLYITLLTLLRILFLGRIGSISYVLPIRQNIDILNRDIRVSKHWNCKQYINLDFNSQCKMYFHPKNLKSERNNPYLNCDLKFYCCHNPF